MSSTYKRPTTSAKLPVSQTNREYNEKNDEAVMVLLGILCFIVCAVLIVLSSGNILVGILIVYFLAIVVARICITQFINNMSSYKEQGLFLQYNPVYNKLEIRRDFANKVFTGRKDLKTHFQQDFNNMLFWDVFFYITPLDITFK